MKQEKIYIGVTSTQAETLVTLLCDTLDDRELSLTVLRGERTKLLNEITDLKTRLANAMNLAEAAVAAQTEKTEL